MGQKQKLNLWRNLGTSHRLFLACWGLSSPPVCLSLISLCLCWPCGLIPISPSFCHVTRERHTPAHACFGGRLALEKGRGHLHTHMACLLLERKERKALQTTLPAFSCFALLHSGEGTSHLLSLFLRGEGRQMPHPHNLIISPSIPLENDIPSASSIVMKAS